jgi:hypothetical protein
VAQRHKSGSKKSKHDKKKKKYTEDKEDRDDKKKKKGKCNKDKPKEKGERNLHCLNVVYLEFAHNHSIRRYPRHRAGGSPKN